MFNHERIHHLAEIGQLRHQVSPCGDDFLRFFDQFSFQGGPILLAGALCSVYQLGE